MNPRFRTLVGLKTIAVLVAMAIPLIVATHVGDLPPPVRVIVAHQARFVPRDTTLGEAVAEFGLRPRSGDLLDVEGKVIRKRAFPGVILLDGEPAALSTKLREGNHIRTVDREDRVE